MKKSTFLIQGDRRILISTETINTDGNCDESELSNGNDNENFKRVIEGNKVTEYNIINGEEAERRIFIYDENGDCSETFWYTYGELNEHVVYEKKGKLFITRQMNNGIEKNRTESIALDENFGITHYYTNGELKKIELTSCNPESKLQTTEVLDPEFNRIQFVIETEDEETGEVNFLNRDKDGEILLAYASRYENGLDIEGFFLDPDYNGLTTYKNKYDDNGNLICDVKFDSKKRIMKSTSYEYDKQNRIVSELHYDAEGKIKERLEYEYLED